MKKTAVAICYSADNDLITGRFKEEAKRSIIDACTPSALTNMQKILFSMDDHFMHKNMIILKI